MFFLHILEIVDHVYDVSWQILEVYLLELGSGILAVGVEWFKSVPELGTEMTDDLIVPRIIFGVDFIEDETVVNDNGAEILLSLTVIEGFSIFPNFIKQILPQGNVIAQFVVYLFRVNYP